MKCWNINYRKALHFVGYFWGLHIYFCGKPLEDDVKDYCDVSAMGLFDSIAQVSHRANQAALVQTIKTARFDWDTNKVPY